jgi:hypothetical protein
MYQLIICIFYNSEICLLVALSNVILYLSIVDALIVLNFMSPLLSSRKREREREKEKEEKRGRRRGRDCEKERGGERETHLNSMFEASAPFHRRRQFVSSARKWT